MLNKVKKTLASIVLASMPLVVGCSTMNVRRTHDETYQQYQQRAGKKVSVLPFIYESKNDATQLLYGATWTKNAGSIVADQLTTALLGTGYDVVLCSQPSDLIKEGKYKEIGERCGVDYIITGTVSEHGAIGVTGIVKGYAAFSATCIDVKTGKVVWSTSVSGNSLYTSPTTVSGRLVEKLVNKYEKTINH